MSFQEIFEKCPDISKAIQNFELSQDKQFQFYEGNPNFELISIQNKNQERKGLYLFIYEPIIKDNQPIKILTTSQKKSATKEVQVSNTLHKLAYFIKTSIATESKNMLMKDKEITQSWVIEYLPDRDKLKLEAFEKRNTEQTEVDQKISQIRKQIQKQPFAIKVQPSSENERRQSREFLQSMMNMRKMDKVTVNASNLKRLMPSELKEIPDLDEKLDQFKFNVFELPEQEKLRTVWSIFNKRNYFTTFNIQLEEFCKFLEKMKLCYNKHKNPFHNFDHAVTVLHGCYMVACKTRAINYLDTIREFSLVFSGLCHDAKHTARTNMFEVNSMSKLAIRYHDKSVLEQNHIAVTFKILRKEEFNIFKNLSTAEYQAIRKNVISNILATDIKEHFGNLKNFENRSKEIYDIKAENLDEKDVQLLSGVIIHTADFHGTAQPFEISQQWSLKVNEEFKQQFTEEGKLGIPQTPYLKDLDKKHILAKSEIGFIKVIVKPLYDTLNRFLKDDIKMQIENLENSIQEWEKIYQKEAPPEDPNHRKSIAIKDSPKINSDQQRSIQNTNSIKVTENQVIDQKDSIKEAKKEDEEDELKQQPKQEPQSQPQQPVKQLLNIQDQVIQKKDQGPIPGSQKQKEKGFKMLGNMNKLESQEDNGSQKPNAYLQQCLQMKQSLQEKQQQQQTQQQQQQPQLQTQQQKPKFQSITKMQPQDKISDVTKKDDQNLENKKQDQQAYNQLTIQKPINQSQIEQTNNSNNVEDSPKLFSNIYQIKNNTNIIKNKSAFARYASKNYDEEEDDQNGENQ